MNGGANAKWVLFAFKVEFEFVNKHKNLGGGATFALESNILCLCSKTMFVFTCANNLIP